MNEDKMAKLMSVLEKLDESKLERLLSKIDEDEDETDDSESLREEYAKKEERLKQKARQRGSNFQLGPRENRFEEMVKDSRFKRLVKGEEQKIEEAIKKELGNNE